MVSNDKLLPQSHFLASTDTALIIRNRILSDQLPLCFGLGMECEAALTTQAQRRVLTRESTNSVRHPARGLV
jgi:hypothetical protein